MSTFLQPMQTASSADGTTIAFQRGGDGPPVVLVLGAFNERVAGEPLAEWLASYTSVVTYDRRGRGDSGDAPTYVPEREIDDLAAIIAKLGGVASVFGYSSGAVLALRAAAAGVPIRALALYEPPVPQVARGPREWVELARDLDARIAEGDRGAAVELFQTRAVGIPPEVVAQLRHAPFWPALERIAHTLSYESQILAIDPGVLAHVTVPVAVGVGSESPAVLQDAARAIASDVPLGNLTILPGQGHDIDPAAVGPFVRAACLS